MARALGPRGLSLVERWEADGKKVVSVEDVRETLGSDATLAAASAMIRRLRDAGFLRRIGRGLYAPQPVAWMGQTAPDAAAVLSGVLARGRPFFIAFDSAAGHYGWHPETYGVVTVAVPQGVRIRAGADDDVQIRTVTVPASSFTAGVATVRWRGLPLPMSDPNRTVVDAVSRVDLIGGYPELLRLLSRAARGQQTDQMAVAQLCIGRGSVRLRKRLGYLCERAGWKWSEAALDLLRDGWKLSHRAALDDARRHHGGDWDPRWRLIINVPDAQLEAEVGVR